MAMSSDWWPPLRRSRRKTATVPSCATTASATWRRAAPPAARPRPILSRAPAGPPLSDLLVRHGPKGVEAARASTGEQKALLVGLVLAQAHLVAAMSNIAPIMLLDEIAAHFDPSRRAALFGRLADLGGQVFITGADPA